MVKYLKISVSYLMKSGTGVTGSDEGDGKREQRKEIKGFKAETIKRLSPR